MNTLKIIIATLLVVCSGNTINAAGRSSYKAAGHKLGERYRGQTTSLDNDTDLAIGMIIAADYEKPIINGTSLVKNAVGHIEHIDHRSSSCSVRFSDDAVETIEFDKINIIHPKLVIGKYATGIFTGQQKKSACVGEVIAVDDKICVVEKRHNDGTYTVRTKNGIESIERTIFNPEIEIFYSILREKKRQKRHALTSQEIKKLILDAKLDR